MRQRLFREHTYTTSFQRGAIFALAIFATDAQARSSPPPCDEVRAAIAGGATLEQITTQFGIDEAQVVKCVQPKRHKGKTKKPKKSRKTSGSTSHQATTGDTTAAHAPKADSTGGSRRPPAPH